jgi:hypothetical protein
VYHRFLKEGKSGIRKLFTLTFGPDYNRLGSHACDNLLTLDWRQLKRNLEWFGIVNEQLGHLHGPGAGAIPTSKMRLQMMQKQNEKNMAFGW